MNKQGITDRGDREGYERERKSKIEREKRRKT